MYHAVTRELTPTVSTHTHTHSHGHAELLQPLLFQLFGLEEELEAALALFMREVESVGPLQHMQEKQHSFRWRRNGGAAYK